MSAGRLAARLVAAALAAVAAGCAASGVPSQREEARDTVQGLLDNCARGQAAAVIDAFVEPARDAYSRGADVVHGCDVVVGLAPDASTDELRAIYEQARVTGVEVDGGFATVEIGAPGGRATTVELESVRGRFHATNHPLPAPPAPTQEAAVRAVVGGLLSACAGGDGAAARPQLTEEARAAFSEPPSAAEGCQAVLRLAPEPPAAQLRRLFGRATVEGVTVQGASATARILAPEGRRSEVPLERVDGGWRVSAPAGA